MLPSALRLGLTKVGVRSQLLSPLAIWSRGKSTQTKVEDDSQYIEISPVPTMHFQPSLPRLPIPALPDTLQRYLRAQRPLLTAVHYIETEARVADFERNEGPMLQRKLVARDAQNKHTSYISAPWFGKYLADRAPLPINYNPFIVLMDETDGDLSKPAVRATNLLFSSLRFYNSLKANVLKPDVFHMDPNASDTKQFYMLTGLLPPAVSWYGAYMFNAYPLDMSQYSSLFNSTRIPMLGKDRLYKDPSKKHLIVMKNGNIFSLNPFDASGKIVDQNSLYCTINELFNAPLEPAEYPVGILTTLDRDTWANMRRHLESIGNAETLETIDSALFVLCLDEVEGMALEDQVHQFLHSDGRNRWFDKSFSLIVTKQGVAGINFEHSWGDGVAILRFCKDFLSDSMTNPRIKSLDQGQRTDLIDYFDEKHGGGLTTNKSILYSAPLATKLEFKLDSRAKSAIESAKLKFSEDCKAVDIKCLEFKSFGRDLCKVHQISPDCVMQLAFQLAYKWYGNGHVPTYESCSTAAFRHGRTETMRPCTLETNKFCLALDKPEESPGNYELKALIADCSKVHTKLIKEACMGQGFDRHLFTLQRLAEDENMWPAIFLDSAYAAINQNVLSTSTLNSEQIKLGGFGPGVQHGFGIGYTILKNRLGAVVSSYRDHSDSANFMGCLSIALKEIHNILIDMPLETSLPQPVTSMEQPGLRNLRNAGER